MEKAFESIEGVREVEVPGEPADGELPVIVRSKGDADLRADIFKTVVDKKWVMLGLERKQVDLESIFRKLTSKDTSGTVNMSRTSDTADTSDTSDKSDSADKAASAENE